MFQARDSAASGFLLKNLGTCTPKITFSSVSNLYFDLQTITIAQLSGEKQAPSIRTLSLPTPSLNTMSQLQGPQICHPWGFLLSQFPGPAAGTGPDKCPNWTSPNYWGYNHQQILQSDLQNPQNRTCTNPVESRGVREVGSSCQIILWVDLRNSSTFLVNPCQQRTMIVMHSGLRGYNIGACSWVRQDISVKTLQNIVQ